MEKLINNLNVQLKVICEKVKTYDIAFATHTRKNMGFNEK